MVPLERVLRQPGSTAVEGFSFPPRKPRPDEPAEPAPREFKLVDVMTREVLAEGVDARAAVEALEGIRSIVDVLVYVRDPEKERWRLLDLDETRALWDFRGRVGT